MLHRKIEQGQRWIEIGETYPIVSGVVVLLLGCGLAFLYFGVTYPSRIAIYGAHGRLSPGAIVNMKEDSDQRSMTYLADIEFQDESGTVHHIRNTYSMVNYFGLREERNATVRYLKSDPSYAFEIHSQQAGKPNLIWYGFQCGLLFLLGTVLILYGRNRSREEEPETNTMPRPTSRKPPGRPLAG